jgi:hypothetical protein
MPASATSYCSASGQDSCGGVRQLGDSSEGCSAGLLIGAGQMHFLGDPSTTSQGIPQPPPRWISISSPNELISTHEFISSMSKRRRVGCLREQVVLEPSARAELHSRHRVRMALQHRDRHPKRQRPDPDGVVVGARRYELVVNRHGEIGDVALMQE